MAILTKNTGAASIPECTISNKDSIISRVQEVGTDISIIKADIARFRTKVAASTDPVIAEFNVAASFPVEDLQLLLANNPGCKYLRIYNAISATDENISYIAAVDDDFNSYENEERVIAKTCCQCKSCISDNLIND